MTDGSGDTDTLLNIERLDGSEFDDILRGDDVRNTLIGREGSDHLKGRGGDDVPEGNPVTIFWMGGG